MALMNSKVVLSVVLAVFTCVGCAAPGLKVDLPIAAPPEQVDVQVRPDVDAWFEMSLGQGPVDASELRTADFYTDYAASDFDSGIDNVSHVATVETPRGPKAIYTWSATTGKLFRDDYLCSGGPKYWNCTLAAAELGGARPLGGFGTRQDATTVDLTPEGTATIVVTFADGTRIGSDVIDGIGYIEWDFNTDDNPIAETTAYNGNAEVVETVELE